MLISALLAAMEVLDNELETGAGEDDEDRAITALDIAQDYLETVAANYPKTLAETGTLTTTANTEATTWPAGLLRLDSLWMLENSIPVFEVTPIEKAGGHANTAPWPLRGLSSQPGQPREFFSDARNIYWAPKPDAIYTLRWYGFKAQASITDRDETFAYPDGFRLPMATFANRLLSVGVGDSTAELESLAEATFTPALRAARRFKRTGPAGRVYTRVHST